MEDGSNLIDDRNERRPASIQRINDLPNELVAAQALRPPIFDVLLQLVNDQLNTTIATVAAGIGDLQQQHQRQQKFFLGAPRQLLG